MSRLACNSRKCPRLLTFPGQRIACEHGKTMLWHGNMIGNHQIRAASLDPNAIPIKRRAGGQHRHLPRSLRSMLSCCIVHCVSRVYDCLYFSSSRQNAPRTLRKPVMSSRKTILFKKLYTILLYFAKPAVYITTMTLERHCLNILPVS